MGQVGYWLVADWIGYGSLNTGQNELDGSIWVRSYSTRSKFDPTYSFDTSRCNIDPGRTLEVFDSAEEREGGRGKKNSAVNCRTKF
ncbi:uncharacterized protein J3R85_016395 [Psidium guajava]|nr:uncharacterized protein J3R85_016395 [Psidium guajava]